MIIARVKKIGSRFGKEYSTFGESKEWHYGIFTKNPVVGERFNLQGWDFLNEGISTSTVQKIMKHNKFCTKNSYYQLEFKEMPISYACYKYYDRLGRRMAIFGTQTNGAIDIIAFPCNLKDMFCINTARNLFYKYRQSGENLSNVLRIIRPGTTQEDFLRFCKDNYGKLVTIGVPGTFKNLEIVNFDKVSQSNSMYLTYVKMPSTKVGPYPLNPAA